MTTIDNNDKIDIYEIKVGLVRVEAKVDTIATKVDEHIFRQERICERSCDLNNTEHSLIWNAIDDLREYKWKALGAVGIATFIITIVVSITISLFFYYVLNIDIRV